MFVFSDMVEKTIAVFKDDLSVVGDSFDQCFDNLAKVLKRCKNCNLVLNWKKCNFTVKAGIVLGIRSLQKGIKVNRS